MIVIWVFLALFLVGLVQPYQVVSFQGLARQETAWDCGPAAAASLLHLAGQEPLPWSEKGKEGTSLQELSNYLQLHGWEVEGYKVDWDQLIYFLSHSPYRPLLAHSHKEQGHYIILLGLIDEWLVVHDPNIGVKALTFAEFRQDFSGAILHFPNLPPLKGVKTRLAFVSKRLNLLGHAWAN